MKRLWENILWILYIGSHHQPFHVRSYHYPFRITRNKRYHDIIFSKNKLVMIPKSFIYHKRSYLYASFEEESWEWSKTLSNNHSRIITKTTESFQLADLFLLETSIQAKQLNFVCDIKAFDERTGSYMLSWSNLHPLDQSLQYHLSGLLRCQWMAEELAFGLTPQDLVYDIHQKQQQPQPQQQLMMDSNNEKKNTFIKGTWNLDYILFHQENDQSLKHYVPTHSKKSLCYCMAQAIKAPASLDPKKANNQLLLIETISGFFLTRLLQPQLLQLQPTIHSNNPKQNILHYWKSRPFQYSSAINPIVADVIVDLLLSICITNNQTTTNDDNSISLLDTTSKLSKLTLLDPCCGCGTFLMTARSKGLNVYGIDCKQKCVEGTISNMEYMFSTINATTTTIEPTNLVIHVHRGDSSESVRRTFDDTSHDIQRRIQPDMVTANLPWGQNTVDYYQANKRILKCLQQSLQQGVPCAFVSKDEIKDDLEQLGFQIKGFAFIPPKHFALPKSYKRKKKSLDGKYGISATNRNYEQQEERKKTTKDCVVTLAIAPGSMHLP